MTIRRVGVLVVLLGLLIAPVRAEDAFFRVPVHQLNITEGTLPGSGQDARGNWAMHSFLRPYVVLDGAGEAYAAVSRELTGPVNRWREEWTADQGMIVARAPQDAAIAGSLFVPKPDRSGMVGVKFTIPPSAATPEARRAFFTIKATHYTHLQRSRNPGTAWFRREAAEALRALGSEAPAPDQGLPRGGTDLDDTYELFTGGRAVSENLQLARDLPPAQPGPAAPDEQVLVARIEGIMVAAMDWTGALGPAAPGLDPLADAIPEDQHAVFFSSFEALRIVADTSAAEGLPIFRALRGGAEDGRLLERYQRQLGLELDTLARALGPSVIQSVAVTGSDPYYPTGTDVAVLFQTGNSAVLRDLLLMAVRAYTATTPGVNSSSGEVDGLAYNGAVSEDRAVSSYVAAVGGRVVVVTNSIEQLRRLAAVQKGSAPAIAGLDEYKFFRQRYPLGADSESGFVFLSDATIRRWCGPEWRVGASRRLRAAALLSDLTAKHLDELAVGVETVRGIESETPMRTIGTLTIGPAGVRSSVYGSLRFLTPIAELHITEVASDEAAAYKRWRDSYQRNWSWAFDPIGATFSIGADRLSGDLTVMPLIVGTQYRTWIDVARGASIKPGAGDPHEAAAQAVLAVNAKSRAMQEAAGFTAMMAPGLEIDPLGWLGQCVSLYADADPFWQELLSTNDADALQERIYHAPVGLYAEVGDAVKLTAFLAAARALIEQSAPGMTSWENRTHNGQAYVRVGSSEQAKAEAPPGVQDAAIYYAPTAKALHASLSEEVLKRAIDRQDAGDPQVPQPPWLGTSMGLRFNRMGAAVVNAMGGPPSAGQRQAWASLAILNEWKRRFPDRDPVDVHAALWGTRLLGVYRWNERFKTMESAVFGHPGEPKRGPEELGAFGAISSGNLGLTFEERGLRARAVMTRVPAGR